jgi:hypothetical protein
LKKGDRKEGRKEGSINPLPVSSPVVVLADPRGGFTGGRGGGVRRIERN